MKKNKRTIWIAWEKHRRTESICDYLGIKPIIFQSDWPRIIKHPFFLFKTFQTLLKHNPSNLLIQNPSLILALFACILRNVFKYNLIIDSHNDGVVPPKKFLEKFLFIYRYIQRTADTTIVTNDVLAKTVKHNGGSPFILPDKLPEVTRCEKDSLSGRFNAAYICTFAGDEPYAELFRACSLLPEWISVYVTGNFKKNKHLVEKKEMPQNIIFTGFLPDDEYWRLIQSVDLVIDLTNMENCLVCGAYEAVSANRPMLLTGTRALREYFSQGAIYTKNEAAEIANAIMIASGDMGRLNTEVRSLKIKLHEQWDQKGRSLKRLLGMD